MTKEEIKQYIIDNLRMNYSYEYANYGLSGSLTIRLELEE